MPITTPPTITALPSPPDPNNRATFNTLAYPWSVAQQTLATEVGAVAANVYDNAQEAEAQAGASATQASNAAASADAANAAKLAAQAAQAAAEGAVATLPEGSIIDATISTVSVWSSQKTNAEIDAAVGAIPVAWNTGDVIQTSRALSAPDWLPCDGSPYLQSSYPALYAELGLIPDVVPGDKITSPATLPTDAATGCSWDSSGTYLAVAHGTSPYITVYQRSGSTLTKLANPAVLPPDTGRGCSWDASGTYLAVAHDTSPYITVYQRSGSTLTKLADPAVLPTGNASGCSWDTSGIYLAVAHYTSPCITVYQRSGSTLTKLADPAALPVTNTTGVSFGASGGAYLAVAVVSTPYVEVYKNIVYDESTQFAVPKVNAGANLTHYIKA